MDFEKYDTEIPMQCPTCGNEQLKTQDNTVPENPDTVTCPACDREMSLDELKELNRSRIEEHLDVTEEKVEEEMAEELGDMLEDAFGDIDNVEVK